MEERYGVFEWRGDWEYKLSDAIKWYVHQKPAENYAAKLNDEEKTDKVYMVRVSSFISQP